MLTFASPSGPAAAAADTPFDDISHCYAQAQILDLYHKNVINGVNNHTFAPDKPITRAEFITILDRALNIQPVDGAIPAFLDVLPSSWFYGSVQAGVELGMIEGTSPDRFEPDKSITRQEASALLIRALQQNADDSLAAKLPFKDSVLISPWAVPYVAAANRLELMVGDSEGFRPTQPITRQETAVVIDKLFTDLRWAGFMKLSTAAPLIQLGWQYNDTTAEYEQKIMQSTVNTLSPRWFFLNSSLGMDDETDPSLVSWAKANHKQIWALVGNHINQELTHQLLSQPEKASAVIKQLSDYANKYQLDGLNIDFEQIGAGDRDSFSSFIENLAKELHAEGKVLSVDVSPDSGTDWTVGFDYSLLGKSADYTVLMAYDEHWDGEGIAGSTSSLPWLATGLKKLEAAVPAQKIIVALPFYTQDWTIQNNAASNQELSVWQQNTFVASQSLHPQWNPDLGQYTSSYTLGGQVHQIWLEDGRSLSLKFQTALSTGAAGIAYWYIGGESPDIWGSLSNVSRYTAYRFDSSRTGD